MRKAHYQVQDANQLIVMILKNQLNISIKKLQRILKRKIKYCKKKQLNNEKLRNKQIKIKKKLTQDIYNKSKLKQNAKMSKENQKKIKRKDKMKLMNIQRNTNLILKLILKD